MAKDLCKKSLVAMVALLFISSVALPLINAQSTKTKEQGIEDRYKPEESNLKKTLCKKPHMGEFVPGEIIVKFKEKTEISPKTADDHLSIGIESLDKLNVKHSVISSEKILKETASSLSNIYKFTVSEGSDILSVVKEYNEDINVEYAEPNYICYLNNIPNDPLFGQQWGLYNTGQTGGVVDVDIDAPEAWDIETGSSNVTIAVIDSGVDYMHPDLFDNIWLNDNEIPDNFIDDDGNGFVDDIRGWDFIRNTNDPKDDFGHGTHCAGIVGAVGNNSVGISGVCWDCKVMSVKVFSEYGSSSVGVLARGISYAAENGADVFSMSWGGSDSQLIKDVLNQAYSKGIVLVASAGNYNSQIPYAPAKYDNVIAVAAIDKNNTKAVFSNYGNWVDVTGPGVDVFSTMPTYHVTLNDYGYTQDYSNMSGTSMSAPYVAGVVGLTLSKNLGMKQEEIKTLIQSAISSVESSSYIGVGNINSYYCIQNNTVPVVNLEFLSDSIEIENIFEITGSASGDTFQEYKIYLGLGVYPEFWSLIDTSTIPVEDGVLTLLDTSSCKERLHTIKLQVEDIHGNKFQDRINVLINNDKTIVYVDDDNYADYNTISEAANNSGSGDTIYVYNGTYQENVFVDKSVSLIGENKNATFILGMVVFYDTINVEISGFTFTKSKPETRTLDKSSFDLQYLYSESKPNQVWAIYNYYCLGVYSCGNVTIKDNIFTNYTAPPLTPDMILPGYAGILLKGIGIELSGCSASLIKNNIIKGHIYDPKQKEKGNSPTVGINLDLCNSVFMKNNIIINNNVISNIDINEDTSLFTTSNESIPSGIMVTSGASNIVNDNTIENNLKGITGDFSARYNDISNNLFVNNIHGLYIYFGGFICCNIHHNIIKNNQNGISLGLGVSSNNINNNIIENNNIGIQGFMISLPFGLSKLINSTQNNIHHNSIKNNYEGIYGESLVNNTISDNNIENNTKYGLKIINSKDNLIYRNNFIKNGRLPLKRNDATAKKGRNKWDNGTEGNYWDNYKGLRFKRLADLDNDGFGNLPYIVPRLQFDKHPKLEPYNITI